MSHEYEKFEEWANKEGKERAKEKIPNKEREKFEKRFPDLNLVWNGNKYVNLTTDALWISWQARQPEIDALKAEIFSLMSELNRIDNDTPPR